MRSMQRAVVPNLCNLFPKIQSAGWNWTVILSEASYITNDGHLVCVGHAQPHPTVILKLRSFHGARINGAFNIDLIRLGYYVHRPRRKRGVNLSAGIILGRI